MNEPAKKSQELEKTGAELEKLIPYISGQASKVMYETGDLNAGTVSVSQSVGLVHKIMPVKDIIEEIMEGAKAALKRFAL